MELIRDDSSITHVIAEHNSAPDDWWMKTHFHVATSYVFDGFTLKKDPSFFNCPLPVMKTTPGLKLWQRKSFQS